MVVPLEVLQEIQLVCRFEGGKVVGIENYESIPIDLYPVEAEIEIMDKERSFGIFYGWVGNGRLEFYNKWKLRKVPDGTHYCIVYFRSSHDYGARPIFGPF